MAGVVDEAEDANSSGTPVTVDIRHSNRYFNRFKRAAELFPRELKATFKVQDTNVRLRLKRAKHIRADVPIYMQIDGKIQEIKVPKRQFHAFYQDRRHLASVAVKCMGFNQDNSTCRHQMSGQLLINGQHHTIEPLSADLSSPLLPSQHKIKLIQSKVDFTSDYIYPDDFDFTKQRRMVENITTHGGRFRRQAISYLVEILSVIDYPIYNYWYTASTETGDDNKATDAIERIWFFQAHLFNAMDVRYQSISQHTSAYTITPVFAGLFIANDSSQSPWTEDNKVTASPKDHVDALVSLQAFNSWRGTATGLPTFDHAMAFTGYDLTYLGSTSNAGLAYVGGLCGTNAVSISEDHFDPVFTIVASHELGHNLNSNHDEDGNACPESNSNVMAPSSGPSSDSSTNTNHYLLSACSVAYFTGFINQLDTDNNNCMTSLSSGYDPNALDQYTALPGEGFTLDDQCRSQMDSQDSFLCRALIEDANTVCQFMYCAIPGTTSCRTKFAWEGTQCGNGKMCINGQCVTDSRALPSLSDTCVFGDTPGIVANGLNCSELIRTNSYACYPQYDYERRCCESCAAAYTCEPGCEYGDKLQGCIDANCPFYDAASLLQCCGTCATSPLQCPTTTQTTPTTTPYAPTTTPYATTTTPYATTTTPYATTTTPYATTTTPYATTTTPYATTTTPYATTTTPYATTTTPYATTTTPYATTSTPYATTTTPYVTTTTPYAPTTTPYATTTTPYATTTTPYATTTTPYATTTTPYATTTTPYATTTTPYAPTTTPYATTTTPYAPTTTPYATTTTPYAPTTTPYAPTTTPYATTTTPYATTTTPYAPTTTPYATTTTPYAPTTTPYATTTTPYATTTTPYAPTTTPYATTTTPYATTTTPYATTTTPYAPTTTPYAPTTTPYATTTTPYAPTTTPYATTTTPYAPTTTPYATTTTPYATTTTPYATTTTPYATTTTPYAPTTQTTTPTTTPYAPTTTTTTTTPTTTPYVPTATSTTTTTTTSTPTTTTTPTTTITIPATTTQTSTITTTNSSEDNSVTQQITSSADLGLAVRELSIYITVSAVGTVGTGVAVYIIYKCVRSTSKVAPVP